MRQDPVFVADAYYPTFVPAKDKSKVVVRIDGRDIRHCCRFEGYADGSAVAHCYAEDDDGQLIVDPSGLGVVRTVVSGPNGECLVPYFDLDKKTRCAREFKHGTARAIGVEL